MKMKRILIVGLLVCTLSGCSLLDKGNVKKGETYENKTMKALDDNLMNANSEVIKDGIAYKITNMTSGKELGNHDMEQVNYLTDEVDKQGNLLGTYRFIWIELTVENKNDEKREVEVNSNNFYGISDAGIIAETGAEGVYISPEEDNRRPSERFHCLLQAGEKRNLELGYLIDVNNVKSALYYGIGNSGSELEDVNNKFLNVEEFWNEE